MTEIAKRFDEKSVRDTFLDVARTRATELLDEQLRPELARARTETQEELGGFSRSLKATRIELNEELSKLKRANEFTAVNFAAQADDRKAWDQLRKWSADSTYPYRELAAATAAAISKQHDQPFSVGWNEPWYADFGPQPPSPDRKVLASIYWRLPVKARMVFISVVSQRNDFDKTERLGMLAEAIQRDQSLAAVEYAGRAFAKLAGIKGHAPLDVDFYLAWWAERSQSPSE